MNTATAHFQTPAVATRAPAAVPGVEIDTDRLQALIAQVSQLVAEAARILGASEADAIGIGQTGMLKVEGLDVAVMPVMANAQGQSAVLVNLDSGRPLLAGDGPAAVLQHTPGLINAYAAALGCTAAGHWTLVRSLPLDTTTARVLAEQIYVTRRLADVVWPAPVQ